MDKFSVRCPDHYPMKCNLSPADKDHLLSREKYKGFFIFQYENQDEWLQPTIERFFTERTWRLFNAGLEGGTGTKFCNVCRYALASDFGIVSLTPLNHNVFQEIGLMQGLQKSLLYVLNPNRKDKLPFDIDDQIYIKHYDEKSLVEGLEKKIPLFIDKVQLLSGFEREQKKLVNNKINELSPDAKTVLIRLVLEGNALFPIEAGITLETWVRDLLGINPRCVNELTFRRFVIKETMSGGTRTLHYEKINESYRKYLEELLWS